MEGLFVIGFVFVVLWIVPIFLSISVWKNKGGGGGAGFALGFFLGWIGVLIAAIATPTAAVNKAAQLRGDTRECPHCKSPIRRDASVCPHCQRESSPWVLRDGKWTTTGTDGEQYAYDPATRGWVKEAPPAGLPEAQGYRGTPG